MDIEVYANTSLNRFPELVPAYEEFKTKYEASKGPLPPKFFETNGGRKEFIKGIKVVFKIERTEETIVGDKLANNHGGKGVITYIEKYENMPVTPWGQPLDIMLNPLAIVGRMNPSTIFEMYTGLIGKFLAYKVTSSTKEQSMQYIKNIYSYMDKTKNQKLTKQLLSGYSSLSARGYANYQKKIKDDNYVLPIMVPQFQAPSKEDIENALLSIGGQTSYHLDLPDYGTKTKGKVACGYLYYKKLEAQSEAKLAGRSTGRYKGSTLQPVSGKKSGGGLRIGEFDSWAIIDHGAINVLKELFGPLSDDHATKNEIISEIIENGEAAYREPKSSATRDLLNMYMYGMMLDTTIKK
jgi:DNA-directed RNA polymerase subunit beta